jgi:hypothetical protein
LAKKGDFASQAAQVGRDGGQAVGENPAADDLRSLRTVSLGVVEVSADAELCGEFGDGPADGKQLNGLGFKPGSV